MVDISEALATSSDGTIITLEVTTGSKTDSFPSGYNPWRKALGCHISALPVDGKANIAIIGLVASVMGVSKNDITIICGITSSQKKILVTGISIEEMKSRIAQLLPA